jgi:two-component sensor histidine kinase
VLAELREQSVREAEQVTESRVLGARQGELARNLKEREVLLQEIHHRVKNNLQVISSLINMQVRKLEAGSSRDALEQCQTRVLAIALIHEKLYQSKDYSEVHFAEYARSLAASVFHALGVSETQVTLELAIDDVPLGVDRAIPCGLLLNELITNALKHAFPGGRAGAVRVELARITGDRLRLVVSDNGVGLPAGVDIQRTGSIGLQLVTTLAEQLEATLEISGDRGATFQLTFSLGA